MAKENSYNENLTLDEIVFENRNKEYGAYDLRHQYPKILTKAFFIGTFLFVLVAIVPFVIVQIQQMNAKEKTEVDANLMEVLQEDKILEVPKEEEPPPPPPPPPKEEPKIEVIQNVVPEPKKAPKVETPPPPISKQLETTTGIQNQEGVKAPAYTPPPPPPSTGTKASTVEAPKTVDTNKVFDSVDQSAEYPGGMGALRSYLANNFDTSLFDGDEGKMTATLKFVVERDGSVSDVKVVQKSGNRDFDDEAARVVKRLKKWKPGKVNGQSVRSFYSVPFTMVFE